MPKSPLRCVFCPLNIPSSSCCSVPSVKSSCGVSLESCISMGRPLFTPLFSKGLLGIEGSRRIDFITSVSRLIIRLSNVVLDFFFLGVPCTLITFPWPGGCSFSATTSLEVPGVGPSNSNCCCSSRSLFRFLFCGSSSTSMGKPTGSS